ncbi:MAG: AAA family ATPase [Actinomycetota bacterium]|nr:AAA family ATPase [Actinomycetota bacterium]
MRAVGEGQDLINRLLADVFGPEREISEDWGEPNNLPDAEVIERASNDGGGERFRKAWGGDFTDYANDASSAEYALTGHLSFYTKSPRQTETLMRGNPDLYRPKWDSHATYLARTILNSKPDEFFDPNSDLRMTTGKGKRKGLLAGAVRLGEMMRHGIEPPDELIDGVLLEGRTHQLFCGPGKGKSWLALWMAVKLVNRGLRVLYLDKENGTRIIRNRLVALGADPSKVDECLVYVPFPSLDLDRDAVEDYTNSLDGFSLVIFDSWINYLAAAGLDENSNGDLARWSTTFCSEARKRNISVLLLDHVGKDSSNGSRGASRKLDEMDVAWELRTLMPFDREQVGMVQLRRKKDREAWLAPTVEFEIGGDPFVMRRVHGLEIEEPDSIKNTLAAIEGFGADGARHGKWLAETEGLGTKKTQFNQAMTALLDDGRVVKVGRDYFAAAFSPDALPDKTSGELVREAQPDKTGQNEDDAQTPHEQRESLSGRGAGLQEKPFPQFSSVRVPSLSGDRAGLSTPNKTAPCSASR